LRYHHHTRIAARELGLIRLIDHMVDGSDPHLLTQLPPAAARLGRAMGRPQPIAIACLAALAGLGWAYLMLMVADWVARGDAAALGPGMSVFDLLARGGGPDLLGRALLDALCPPRFGAPSLGASAAAGALILPMWGAMTLAMMLPTAAGMVATYAQIVDTAARKGEPAVSPLILAGGYVAVWLGFAALATVLQIALTRLALLDTGIGVASPLFAGAIFLGAGAYQFTALKHACLTRCQRPFPFFFANWTTTPSGVFRLGARQGLDCLGCCWATMLVMFAVGVMNVVWMAGLGLVMAAEKLTATPRLSRVMGIVFLAIGAALIASFVAAHWPRAA
jgi:predicted metal-binding membrane protein